MGLTKLLVANRAEIAIRIVRAAQDLGISTVGVAPEDDLGSLHTRVADRSVTLAGRGAAAYLDVAAIVEAAVANGCDGLHPGYGFLAENAELARACESAGILFVGPTPAHLTRFGDKLEARALATALDVPLVAGTGHDTTVEEAEAFLADNGPLMIKAVAGGGGRGMRPVRPGQEVAPAWERARSEAQAAFGNPAVYVETLIERARHIEVQIIGDGATVAHLGERECTLQRQNQKIVEIAPSPSLTTDAQQTVTEAAVAMAAEVGYRSLGTWEFLVDADGQSRVAFMETNARIQVEHTVTEEVTGVDLVQAQLRIAGGETLGDLGLDQAGIPAPRGHAVQVRVNSETMTAEGTARPSGGTLVAFEAPTGPGIRTDTYGYVGYTTNPAFDSLLAKVIGHASSTVYADAVQRARRALAEFRVEGVATNIGFLQALLDRPEVVANDVTTSFVTDNAAELVDAAAGFEQRYFATAVPSEQQPGLAGARVDPSDPLAVLTHGSIDGPEPATGPGPGGPAGAPPPPPSVAVNSAIAGPDGSVALEAPLQGTIVAINVAEGDAVAEGQQLLVMEAMKMEHEIRATVTGVVRQLAVAVGDTVFDGHPLAFI
ncbi:MAG: biotin carboxylase N-terminal domain-containing protein, partial [Acidimicrobiales bacterium]